MLMKYSGVSYVLCLLPGTWALRAADVDGARELKAWARRPVNQAVHRRPINVASYKTWENTQTAALSEHMRHYDHLRDSLASHPRLRHSKSILHYVSTLRHAPTLTDSGCLYLPTDESWRDFYRHIPHPYPPHFAEMVANAFYPDCGNVSLAGATKEHCSQMMLVGESGCISTTKTHSHEGFHVYETDGIVGLPLMWSNHLSRMNEFDREDRRYPGHYLQVDLCKQGSKHLGEIPKSSKLVIPTKIIICKSDDSDQHLDEKMVEDQIVWLNKAYRGASPLNLAGFEKERPQQSDMQMEFVLENVTFSTDASCAKFALSDVHHATRLNSDPENFFTVVVVGDDQTGMLGRSPLPTLDMEPQMHMVLVSAAGLRNFASENPLLNLDLAYNEGDTIVHEAGHALGLYHTFQDGCDGSGDLVDDTEPEDLPHYLCADSNSCGGSDPVHNFMDYTADVCMAGFTEMQKRRAWCVFENYRPSLFQKALVTR